MDLSIDSAVLTLRPGETVRFFGSQGSRITGVRGAAWITQDADTRDIVLEGGDDFVLDGSGATLVQALGGPAQLALEDGVSVARSGDRLDPAVLDHQAIHENAARARAEAAAWLVREFGIAVRGLWARLQAWRQRSGTRAELHQLSDHMLRDIGIRRTEIDCLTR